MATIYIIFLMELFGASFTGTEKEQRFIYICFIVRLVVAISFDQSYWFHEPLLKVLAVCLMSIGSKLNGHKIFIYSVVIITSYILSTGNPNPLESPV